MSAQPMKPLVLDLLQQGHRDEEAFWQGLSESERSAIGTPELWSAKDHMVHRTYWHQDLIQKLTAIQDGQEVGPREESDDQINARVFEQQKLRSWSELREESEQTYADLAALVERLSEDDLTNSKRFTAIVGERPLYSTFFGNCYEHDEEHFAQYYSDRGDIAQATRIRERCANRVLEAAAPDWLKGSFLYNLACFYAKQNELEKADTLLAQALTLAPEHTEWSKKDPDLAALRNRVAE